MLETRDCCICSQVLGDSKNDLIATLLGWGSYVRRIPIEGEKFAVIPSLGPLTPGHTLLCPKEHYTSFARLPDECEEEYVHLKARLSDVLESVYKLPIHCFEHGMARKGTRVLCTVEHAHLHFVPAKVAVWSRLEVERVWETVGEPLADLRRAVAEMEYLYYEGPDRTRRVATLEPDRSCESQYLRKVFADALGASDRWDWRQVPAALETHEIYETIERSVRV